MKEHHDENDEECENGKDEDENNTDKNGDDECEFYIDCHTPFCLWSHPELDHKEIFYFIGHYLGLIAPKHYRMCFPLYITKWWNEISYYLYYIFHRFTLQKRKRRLLKKPLFITFDGCAQYMTSPTAPYPIAQTYKDANQPPLILIS